MNNKIILSLSLVLMFFATNNVLAAPCNMNVSPDAKPNRPAACGMYGPSSNPFNMSSACQEKMRQEHEKRKSELDKRLNLTEAQKAAIEKNRVEDKEKMKLIYDEMKVKKLKIQDVYNSTLSKTEKNRQVSELKSQINDLRMKARCCRKENMKKFEENLTSEQQKEFKKMKKEHKKEMNKKLKHNKNMVIPPRD